MIRKISIYIAFQLALLLLLGSIFFLGEVYSASFDFSPPAQTFKRECEASVDLLINATGQSSNSAEAVITFDPALITIIDQNPGMPGIQIEPGNAFSSYFYNEVNNSNGTIRLAALSIDTPLTTTRLFGTIHFVSTSAASTANFNIQFTLGDTTDSNIAENGTGNDILTSVTNGTYSFTSSTFCEDDFIAPTVTFLSPTNNQTNVPLDSNLTFRIVDNGSGINLSSLSFVLNGTTYTTSSPFVSFTGSGNDYTFTINPPSNLPANQSNSLTVSGSDLAANNFSSQIVFFTNNPSPPPPPAADTTPPAVVFVNPISQDVNVGADEEIIVEILDTESGVNLDTVRIYFNGQEFTATSPGVTYTTIPGGYRFVLLPPGGIPTNQVNYLQVRGADGAGNTFDEQIVFNVPLTEPITCPNPYAQPETQLPDTGGTIYIPQDGEIIIDNQGRRILFQNCYGDNVDSDELSSILSQILSRDNNIFEDTIFENTIIEEISKQIGVAGLGALLTALLVLFNILPLLSILSIPGALFQFIGIVFGKTNKNPWGVITDGFTGKPVAFAVCQLFVSGSQFKINQSVSDLEGRYGFVINPGDYRLEVKQSGYKQYVEEISIANGEDTYLNDIKLTKEIFEEKDEEKRSFNLNFLKPIWKVYKKISNILFYFGFAASVIATIVNPVFVNIIILLIYTVISIALAAPKFFRSNKYSSIVDSESSLRIPNAQIKIFDLNTWKLVDSQVTNYNGQFDFYGEEGEYAILVASRGYNFPSKKNSYAVTENKYSAMLKVPLKKGRNKIKIYIDPVTGYANTTGAMNSPFS